MKTTFRTKPSNWIMGLYWGMILFFAAMMAFIPFVAEMTFLQIALFNGMFLGILLMFIFILHRAYTLAFSIAEKELVIKGVFKTHRIKRSGIKSVEKVPIPVGVRLAGASMVGGFYYVPSIGKAWVAMNNFADGVLVKTNDRNYIITPESPQEFIKLLKK